VITSLESAGIDRNSLFFYAEVKIYSAKVDKDRTKDKQRFGAVAGHSQKDNTDVQ
jgi:hypothetical protein